MAETRVLSCAEFQRFVAATLGVSSGPPRPEGLGLLWWAALRAAHHNRRLLFQPMRGEDTGHHGGAERIATGAGKLPA